MKLAYKLGAGATAAAMATLLFAGSAFAKAPKCVIKDNGNNSTNTCTISKTSTKTVTKTNFALVGNLVIAAAGTGNNEIKNNTGGTSDLDSGNATVTVTITNTVNQNN